MDYSAFKEAIVKVIGEKLGKDYRLRTFEVKKNNGILLDNLSISREGDTISPCIYLQYYYGEYMDGKDLDQLSDDMIDYYFRSLPSHFDPEKFFNDENIRRHLVCRLVNTKRNTQLLAECPHVQYLNLSVIFYLLFDDEEIGAGAVVLHNSNLEDMNLREDELLDLAIANMKRMLPADLVAMDDLIRELRSGKSKHSRQNNNLMSENESADSNQTASEDRSADDGDLTDDNITDDAAEDEKLPLYVLTNTRRSYGAAWIMDPDVLKKISGKLEDDFYILPSSVHECMILPVHFREDPDSLAQMVEEINESQVAPEEILSDNVYVYHRKEGVLKIAA